MSFWAWHFGLNVCRAQEGNRSCSGWPSVLLVGDQCQHDRQLCVFPPSLLFLSFSPQQHMGVLEAVSSLLSTWWSLKVPAVNLSDKVRFYSEFCCPSARRKITQTNDSQKSDVSSKRSREILNLFRSMEKKSYWLEREYIFHLWFSQASLGYGKKKGECLLTIGFF